MYLEQNHIKKIVHFVKPDSPSIYDRGGPVHKCKAGKEECLRKGMQVLLHLPCRSEDKLSFESPQ